MSFSRTQLLLSIRTVYARKILELSFRCQFGVECMFPKKERKLFFLQSNNNQCSLLFSQSNFVTHETSGGYIADTKSVV